MIKIEHLKKAYPNVTPLMDVNVEIRDGDVISVIGPSGTGKSTLLRCINLLEKPTSGRIWIDGEEITAPQCNISKIRQKMGMVFQSFNLFGHMTVIENIMLSPVYLKKISRQAAYNRGMELLRMVGLAEKALSYPDELSGGQKQRIAIARTLAMDPEIILLDEPTSALDPTMVGEVQAVIRTLAETGKTLMIVTHEMNFARAICNRVFYMDGGGIYEEGTPEEIFDHPKRENTRRFIQHLKVLELSIKSRDYDFLGMATRIRDYCSKNQIAPKLSNRILLAFEEATQLLFAAPQAPRIQAAVEYAEASEHAKWTLRYDGPRLDVTKAGDPLSRSVLSGMAESMEYAWEEGDEYPNRLVLEIKSERTSP
ncbi:MAG: amino acid ABC transporter ATP-binding protein [Clostridia bacterium]|nr:amino acid ABC transporter ATP-binding protein [Clostridia bacterium]